MSIILSSASMEAELHTHHVNLHTPWVLRPTLCFIVSTKSVTFRIRRDVSSLQSVTLFYTTGNRLFTMFIANHSFTMFSLGYSFQSVFILQTICKCITHYVHDVTNATRSTRTIIGSQVSETFTLFRTQLNKID